MKSVLNIKEFLNSMNNFMKIFMTYYEIFLTNILKLYEFLNVLINYSANNAKSKTLVFYES